MAGEGSMQHMRNVLKANKSLLDKRVNVFERGKRFSELRKRYKQASGGKLDSQEISKEDLAIIRQRVIKQQKTEQRKTILIWVVILLMLIPVGIFLREQGFFQMRNINTTQTTEDVEKYEKYIYCIEDGDSWLKKNRWHNAIFQYEEALKLYSSDTIAKNRLAIAYTYRCRDERKDCDIAKGKIDELLKLNPDKVSLHEMLASYYYGINDSISAQISLDRAIQLSTEINSPKPTN